MNPSYTKLTFPSTGQADGPAFDRVAIIRALRILVPSLGIKEAKDLTYATGPQVLQLECSGMSTQEYFGAMHTLAENAVLIEPYGTPLADTPESVHREKDFETAMPELRALVLATLRRKEYETATQLVRILKDLDKS